MKLSDILSTFVEPGLCEAPVLRQIIARFLTDAGGEDPTPLSPVAHADAEAAVKAEVNRTPATQTAWDSLSQAEQDAFVRFVAATGKWLLVGIGVAALISLFAEAERQRKLQLARPEGTAAVRP